MRRKLTITPKSKLPFRYLFLRIARFNGYLTRLPQCNHHLDVADHILTYYTLRLHYYRTAISHLMIALLICPIFFFNSEF